jgi:hypothetical protein
LIMHKENSKHLMKTTLTVQQFKLIKKYDNFIAFHFTF